MRQSCYSMANQIGTQVMASSAALHTASLDTYPCTRQRCHAMVTQSLAALSTKKIASHGHDMARFLPMREGKKGTAPCGHEGTYILPSVVTCDSRCEMKDSPPALELSVPGETRCLHSNRLNTTFGMFCCDCGRRL